MPNWCMNEVSIHGEEQEVAKFVEECFTEVDNQQVLDFDKVIPEPDYDKGGTHDWCNQNWGTKWNIVPNKSGDLFGYSAEIMKDYIHLTFDTAWSPPDGIYDAIFAKYPDLDVNWFYREDNMQLAGWLPYE